jgi:hypothetical protein
VVVSKNLGLSFRGHFFQGAEYFPLLKGIYSRAPRSDLPHILPEGRADEYKVGCTFWDFLKINSGKKFSK